MGSTSSPVQYGNRLLTTVVDDLARFEPERALYSIPLGTTAADGFRSVTTSEFANAVNRAAWFLEKTWGGRGVDFETLGYIGPNDIRYFILVLGAVKSGYKLLLNSPRNSTEGHVAVLEAAKCNKWLVPAGVNIDAILKLHPMQTAPVPSLETFLDKTPVTPYKYEKEYDAARQEPIGVLHTSGSTGYPKPIVLTHGYAAAIDTYNTLQPHNGHELVAKSWRGRRIYGSLPFFHAAGFYQGLLMVIFGGAIVVISPQSPSILAVEQMLDHADLDAILVAPSILDEISQSPALLEKSNKLEWAAYGGGPLSKAAGDRVSEHTKVQLLYGTTECGVFPLLEKEKGEWNYFHIHPAAGIVLRPHATNNWEAFIVRKPELEKTQAVFFTFPDLDEYSLHDLFSKNPAKPELLLYQGRDDDILVLSNGEKIQPTDIQHTIEEHPAVRAALVAGQSRFQASVIIEPVNEVPPTESEREALIDSIFPFVEKANKSAAAHAQIDRQHIILTAPGRPFQRTPKGTVQRGVTLKSYEAELDDLYDNADERAFAKGVKYDTTSVETLRDGIRRTVLEISGFKDFPDGSDLFAAGVDSLQVLNIQTQIQASLGRREGIDSKLIYSNPSIETLSRAVWGVLHPEDSAAGGSSVDAMNAVFEKYTQNLPVIKTSVEFDPSSDARVIVTGSTGSLGSYLLDTLMNTPNVKEIWALNRSEDAESRNTKSGLERGLRTDWAAKNVHFFKADLSKPLLGLSEENYGSLLKGATHIIHNQWQVNFNVPLSSFEPHIRGVRHLVDFSAASAHLAQITFISSVGACFNWSEPRPVPEEPIKDFAIAGMGYGESKLVSENILYAAAAHGTPARVTRVGQIAGPVLRGDKGAWNLQEWLPTIVKSSSELSVLPSDLGNMDVVEWIPVDLLSKILTELTLQSQPTVDAASRVFHLVNPHVTKWINLLPRVQSRLASRSGKVPKVVPWNEWVETLRQAGTSVVGYKLLGFYEGLASGGQQVEFATTETQKASATARDLKAIDDDAMELWMQQWGL